MPTYVTYDKRGAEIDRRQYDSIETAREYARLFHPKGCKVVALPASGIGLDR